MIYYFEDTKETVVELIEIQSKAGTFKNFTIDSEESDEFPVGTLFVRTNPEDWKEGNTLRIAPDSRKLIIGHHGTKELGAFLKPLSVFSKEVAKEVKVEEEKEEWNNTANKVNKLSIKLKESNIDFPFPTIQSKEKKERTTSIKLSKDQTQVLTPDTETLEAGLIGVHTESGQFSPAGVTFTQNGSEERTTFTFAHTMDMANYIRGVIVFLESVKVYDVDDANDYISIIKDLTEIQNDLEAMNEWVPAYAALNDIE